MGVKTSESLLEILLKISETLKKEGFLISILKQTNIDTPFYQVEGIKEREGFKERIMVKIFQRKDGNKTIQIVQKEYENIMCKFKLIPSEVINKKESKNFEKNEIITKLNLLKDKKYITFTIKENENNYLYKVNCSKENYEITLNHYRNGTFMLQGTKSYFSEGILSYILKNDFSIIENYINCDKELNFFLKSLQENQFQNFLNKKPLSEEQKNIAESEEDIIVVNAVAGSGKTTTLEGVINRWNNKRILYIVYNKKMKEEAEYRFKYYQNVKIVTGHSMAYEKYSLRNTKENLDIIEIIKELNVQIIEAAYVKKIFQLFLIDKSLEYQEFINLNKGKLREIYFISYFQTYISYLNRRKEFKTQPLKIDFHINFENIIDFLKKNKIYDTLEEKFLKMFEERILKNLETLDLSIVERKISETHDFYLKKFQIDREQIFKYDIIMLDEAQDSNDVMIDILEYKFPGARKIIVGDTNQQIYAWRGAKNAMEYFSEMKGVKNYHLTHSYRVGNETANDCMEILSIKNSTMKIVGKNINQKKILFQNLMEDSEGELTILYRKNINMILEAINSVEQIAFLKDINLEKFLDVKYFYYRQKGKIKYLHHLKRYSSYEELLSYIGEGWEENPEVILGVKLMSYLGEEFEEKIYELISRVISFESYKNKKPDEKILVLGTVHSSKGYEFERLRISLDLVDFIEKLEIMTKENIVEELNLIYVALTRSSEKIYYPFNIKKLKNLLNQIFRDGDKIDIREQEKHLKALYSSALQEVISAREIKELIHFTRMDNLKGILKNGILSVDKMRNSKIDFIQNDFIRLDDFYDYISTSISFPNYKMLYMKKKETKEPYVVIGINPKILLEKKCLFFPTNAASKRFEGEKEEYSSLSHFEKLFDNSSLNFPKNYPKDSQAEILIKDSIEISYIESIYLESSDYTEERANFIYKNAKHIKFLLGQEFFEKRKW